MVRETRGVVKAASEAVVTTPIKRKRRGSPSPVPTAIKLVVPAAKAATVVSADVQSKTPNGKQNGEDHEKKRAKISLKLKRGQVTEKEEPAVPDLVKDIDVAVDVPVKTETPADRALSKPIRDALASVITEAACNLPAPLNKIMNLWLPPDFAEKPENTLGYVLAQDSLTWEDLVDLLHVFAKNLLTPCNYPNPMPSRLQFHLPVPALPSHYPPHPIYTFCADLQHLMLQIAPRDVQAGTTVERWGLVQKVPNGQSSSLEAGDWFTAGVDSREIGGLLEKLKNLQGDTTSSDSLLEQLASTGDRFGHANAISMQSASGDAKPIVRTLNDSVIRKASLKAREWKAARAAKKGGFGNSVRAVRLPPMTDVTFSPSFGATYDSNHYFAGYFGTLDAMHERARHRVWSRNSLRKPEVGQGYRGSISADQPIGEKGKSKETLEDILEDNARLLEELQDWQNLRVQTRDAKYMPEREKLVADELLASLTKLAGMTMPSDLLSSGASASGMAHRIAQHLLQNQAPSIRGTLDARRPRALHDNLTVRSKPQAAQPLGGAVSQGSMSPSTYPPRQSSVYQPPRQQPSYPTPSTPYRPPTPNYTYTSPFAQPQYNGSTPPLSQQHQYRPPLAGPSGLRQSFGPGTPNYANSPVRAGNLQQR